MGHCFYLQYTGHYRFLRKMSLKEGLVGGYVFNTYDVVGTNFDHLIHQLERIAMRK